MPPIDDTLTIRPLCCLRISGNTALVMSTRPNTLVSNIVAHGCIFAFLDGGKVTVTGVIDEHVDASEALLGLGDGSVDLRAFGDVERQHECPVVVALGDVRDFRRHHAP